MSDLFHRDIPEPFLRKIFQVIMEEDRHIYQVLTKRPARATRFYRDHRDLSGVAWVIAGGESGPVRRPMDLDWARSLRDQCLEQGVPFFFKQVGGRTPKAGGRELDGRTWDEWPVPEGVGDAVHALGQA